MTRPWYHAGLRFECTQCGACCKSRGEHTYLYLMPEDVAAIADHLGLERDTFHEQYCYEEDGWSVVRADRPECPFLDEAGRCSVYPVRPRQCSSWPFWDENLRREIWESSVLETCPGAGQGRLYSADEVEQIAQDNEDWYLRDLDD